MKKRHQRVALGGVKSYVNTEISALGLGYTPLSKFYF